MPGNVDLPWMDIHDFLLEVGSAPTREEMVARACRAMDGLIPFDHSCACTHLDGHAERFVGVPSESQIRLFNEYYCKKAPFWRNGRLTMPIVLSWTQIAWSYFGDTEFVADFMRPLRVKCSMVSIVPGRQFFLLVSRSQSAPPFSERERSIFDLVSYHFNNYYSIYRKLDVADSRSLPTKEAIRDRFPALSRRESEILSLINRGLSAREIGSRLFIGTRTVETHIMHIYDKLNARSKREIWNMLDAELRQASPSSEQGRPLRLPGIRSRKNTAR